jgi:BirA family biotin operon repressor/biotin-[acetyl-CoA-carboxylase] ligase
MDGMLLSGDYISGGKAAARLGTSRTAVFKHMNCLRKQGYDIESRRGKGYRIVPRFDGLLPLEVRMKLRSSLFGGTVITLPSTGSSQEYLRKLAEEGADAGTIVVALCQNAGKGRMGRQWFSPEGGLWLSLLLRPNIPLREIHKLPLLFGVSVSSALDRFGVETRLKWPNDLLVGGKKICGILMEISAQPERVEYVLVGIGVNANFHVQELPQDLRSSSASILDLLGKCVDRAELLSSILEKSEALYAEAERSGFAEVINAWRSRSCTLGHRVLLQLPKGTVSGTARELNEDGSLLVDSEGGPVSIYAGDLTLLTS